MISQNTYYLPLRKSDILGVRLDSPAHVKGISENGEVYNLTHAIDFRSYQGSPIKAALEGKVVLVQTGITENWDKWTAPPKEVMSELEQDGNSIVIEHGNKQYNLEFTRYSHLKPGEIFVKVGDYVQTGQVIGNSGHTGWSIKPHLHFVVSVFTRPEPSRDSMSLKINWDKEDAEWIKDKMGER